MGIVVLAGNSNVYLTGLQSFSLILANEAPSTSVLIGALMSETDNQKIWNEVLLNESYVVAWVNPVAIGDHFPFLLKSPIGYQDERKILTAIRDAHVFSIMLQYGVSFQSVLSILNELQGIYEGKTSPYIQAIITKLLHIDPFSSIEAIQTSFALDEGISSVKNVISEGFHDILSIESSISSSVSDTQAMLIDISDLSDLIQVHKILGSIYEVQAKFSAIDYKIYLDGVDVSKYIVSDITIEKNQDNIHNSISFHSASQELYEKANPSDLYGEVRIEVHINNTVMYFLLEERSHTDDGTVSYWGRDATARDNSPYSPSVYIQLSEPTSAQEVCETYFSDMKSVIDWEVLDWVLPSTFESTGSPIEIISAIATELGAIVRAENDGSLKVRYYNTVRPVNLSTAETDYLYYDGDVYGVEYEMEFGDGYTSVIVTADTDDKVAPILEVEDAVGDERIIGEDTYIRAYYFESPPESSTQVVLNQDVTDGIITFLSIGTEEITEIIVFEDGAGSSSYPLKTLKNITWLGRQGTIQTWDEYSTDITLDTDSNCLAEVTYDAEYYRYKASGHNVEELLAVFEIESYFVSSVKVLMPDDSVQGEEIVSSYLTSLAALSKRGEIWLDQNKYNEETIQFESPFVDDVSDGSIVWLEADRITAGKYQVFDAGITINGPKVVNNFTVKRWQV